MSQEKTGIRLRQDLSAEDLRRCRERGAAAVDAEFTGLNPYRDLLCLVQVWSGEGPVVLVKRREWDGADNLRSLLVDVSVTKIFHYGVMDCAYFLKYLGAQVANVYCTKIASKLARTYSPAHGLSALVKELLSIEIDKQFQTSDWLAGDLTREQLEYAANDVLYLFEIKSELDKKLETRGMLPSGITARELNDSCRAFMPTLAHLALNGWELGGADRRSIFSH